MRKLDADKFIDYLQKQLIHLKDDKTISEEQLHSFHEWILITMDFLNDMHAPDCSWHQDWHSCECGIFK
jgi:hypothetical protein